MSDLNWSVVVTTAPRKKPKLKTKKTKKKKKKFVKRNKTQDILDW